MNIQSTEELTIEEAIPQIENNSDYFQEDYPFVKKINNRYFFICKDGLVEAEEYFSDSNGFQDYHIKILNVVYKKDMCLIEEEILIIKEEANKKIEGFTELLSILERK